VLNIIYTQNVLHDSFSEILKPYELSSDNTMLRIYADKKASPPTCLSSKERMLAKTSNTTRLVDKLLLKDFVTREVCPENRRKIEVHITQKGLDVLTVDLK
jgi:DNA-binding MarR family transcriptional regulator